MTHRNNKSRALGSLQNTVSVVDIEQCRGASLIRVSGDLDAKSIGPLVVALDATIERSPLRVFVIFDQCRFLDSSALLVLLRARDRLGTALKLIDPQGGIVRRILEITGLKLSFDVRASLEEALTTWK